MVRHYLDRDIDGKEAYVMVGTEGKKLVMNEDNPEKNPVVLVQNYWTAFCYTDQDETYSWVYVQENSPDSVQVSFFKSHAGGPYLLKPFAVKTIL